MRQTSIQIPRFYPKPSVGRLSPSNFQSRGWPRPFGLVESDCGRRAGSQFSIEIKARAGRSKIVSRAYAAYPVVFSGKRAMTQQSFLGRVIRSLPGGPVQAMYCVFFPAISLPNYFVEIRKLTVEDWPLVTLIAFSQVLGSENIGLWTAASVKTSRVCCLPASVQPSCQATTS